MARRGKVYVKGWRKVKRNLNKAINEIEENSTEALIEFAKDIHRNANTRPPLIPKDTGNLIESRFITTDTGMVAYGKSPKFSSKNAKGEYKRGRARNAYLDHQRVVTTYLAKAMQSDDPFVYFGYSVGYALFVHELGLSVRPGASPINWTRPSSGPKFMQAAVKRKTKDLEKILYKHIHIKRIARDIKLPIRRPRTKIRIR